ncbi:MAG: crotonase/enoyl-CoA hydratase family protein [SAR86 cluster bacterium]|jgi:enoyl-CoA hydratase|nr:crotonase/enoyl-CoA hydratase family protein [SAR86 cluster bacterium]
MAYSCFKYDIKDKIAHIQMCRPDEFNSMNRAFWSELPDLVETISNEASSRVIVLSAQGKHFCAGMDLANFAPNPKASRAHLGTKKESAFRGTLDLQNTISCLEKARVPVIAAIQGACVGGGVDLATAADVRYCTKDAFFCIQEINIGIAADVGTLQRLPHLIPEGLVRELAFTGRRFDAEEALKFGLVNAVYDNHKEMLEGVLEVAKEIAKKGPLAITSTKEILNYGRDHSMEDSLNYVALWNNAMGISDEMSETFKAQSEKRDPDFEDLLPRRKYMEDSD